MIIGDRRVVKILHAGIVEKHHEAVINALAPMTKDAVNRARKQCLDADMFQYPVMDINSETKFFNLVNQFQKLRRVVFQTDDDAAE